ncbi:hypothetical protein HELRODRAFT_131926, partial [Helobdella robusta]|uniref:Armadillo repeat-containing protein 8 n=1 Tax=Helobdella robusta TaxID=6412 RepID=T1EHW7_HELRO
ATITSSSSPTSSSSSLTPHDLQHGDMIYSLLSILGTHNKDEMSRSLHAMSLSPESCVAMRQSGCLPLLIHLLHNSEPDPNHFNIRSRSSATLRNIINVHCEDQRGRQESRVLRLLEQVRDYCDHLKASALYNACSSSVVYDDVAYFQDIQHPLGAATVLMKLTFDEEHRHAICTLGGIQALAELLQLQQELFGHTLDPDNLTMRRYTCMALTNLTFGDGTNKALLCSMPGPLRALVIQLESPCEDLCQVAASVLRNLSWHADTASKKYLRAAGAVEMLTRSILIIKKESTLKSLLSALWNFSSHCPENKEDICAIRGALQLLVWSLNFKSPSKTLAVVENGGGVLRNVSSHVATRADYRSILRQHGCLPTLLKHLRSPSLTVVSNACGTLWNLSA